MFLHTLCNDNENLRGYLNLKRSGADEGHAISTDVRLALIFYAPTSKNLEGHIVFALFVISFVCFHTGLNHCFG